MVTYVLNAISNIFLIYSSLVLIDALNINKLISLKRFLVSGITSFLFSFIILFLYIYNYNPLSFFIYPIAIIVVHLIAFNCINVNQIFIILSLELTSTLFGACLSPLLFYFSRNSHNISDITALIFIRLIFLIFIVALKKNKKFKSIYIVIKTIPKHIFLLVIISLIIIDSLIICNNAATHSTLKQNIVTGLIALLTIILVIMIFSLLVNVASKNYYTTLNSLLEKQVEAQIAHYEKLEELNRDIRQLRHDYINHLTSVSTLIEHKNYSDALQYIERLTESTHCNETIYSTGNHLADAILTGKSNECKEFADIEFNGIITDRINNMDMCAILANALDNAIEACRKCSGRSKISIAAQNKQGYWVMTMRNPTIGEDSEGLMKTSKEDTQNHGFGLLSIEQAVKRYDGNIKVGIKDGVFEISIVVKSTDT